MKWNNLGKKYTTGFLKLLKLIYRILRVICILVLFHSNFKLEHYIQWSLRHVNFVCILVMSKLSCNYACLLVKNCWEATGDSKWIADLIFSKSFQTVE